MKYLITIFGIYSIIFLVSSCSENSKHTNISSSKVTTFIDSTISIEIDDKGDCRITKNKDSIKVIFLNAHISIVSKNILGNSLKSYYNYSKSTITKKYPKAQLVNEQETTILNNVKCMRYTLFKRDNMKLITTLVFKHREHFIQLNINFLGTNSKSKTEAVLNSFLDRVKLF